MHTYVRMYPSVLPSAVAGQQGKLRILLAQVVQWGGAPLCGKGERSAAAGIANKHILGYFNLQIV